MSVYPTREIRSALLRKGFRQDNTHHHMYWLYIRGRRERIVTRVSHSIREYGASLLAAVAKEMRLRRQELDSFLNCEMGYQDYLAPLNERGTIRL